MNKLLSVGFKAGIKGKFAEGLTAGLTSTGICMVVCVGTCMGAWLGLSSRAIALPGQTVEEAEAWMQAHPTLRALPAERLSIRRSATPASRYTFHGSAFGPGGGSGESLLVRRRSGDRLMVRSEKLTLVDVVRGVDIPYLEDSLRTIYGAEVFADYRRAQSVLVYSPGRAEDRGTERALRSHLLEGDLYGYLIEILPNSNGTVHTGAITVMLREDIAAVQAGVRSREIHRRELENPTGEPIHINGPTLDQLLR